MHVPAKTECLLNSFLKKINVKNHADALIFHMQICAGASQICLMADANWKFAPPRRAKRSGMKINVKNKRDGLF